MLYSTNVNNFFKVTELIYPYAAITFNAKYDTIKMFVLLCLHTVPVQQSQQCKHRVLSVCHDTSNGPL